MKNQRKINKKGEKNRARKQIKGKKTLDIFNDAVAQYFCTVSL